MLERLFKLTEHKTNVRTELVAGSIGSDARALGGALLPLHANFAPDRDLFLKT